MKWNRCVKKCKLVSINSPTIFEHINTPRFSQLKFSSSIPNWFGWILKLAAVNPEKEARPHNGINPVSSFNPWNLNEPFCNSDIWAKLSFLGILLHCPLKQLLPLTNTSKLSQIQIKLLETMNAEALKCFQNFVFCCVVYTLIPSPFWSQFVVESSRSWLKAFAQRKPETEPILHFADRHD